VPVVYRCSNCGYILDIFLRVGQNSYGVPTPSELASRYGGVCPRCGKPLNTHPDPDLDIELDPHGLDRLVEVLREAQRSMRIRFRSIMELLPEDVRARIEAPEETILPATRPAAVAELEA